MRRLCQPLAWRTASLMRRSLRRDGFLPRNGHGIRYHQPEHVLIMYYPQDTVAELGPTEILPCTQYVLLLRSLGLVSVPPAEPAARR